MELINLLHCIDRSADYSNRRSYLLLRRQANTASCKVGNQSERLLHCLASPTSLHRHRSCNRRSSACPRNSAHPSSALRQYLAADKHQFMAKIIRERRLVIRMSGPLLAEAAGAKGRAAAGQARKVLVDFAKQRAAHGLGEVGGGDEQRVAMLAAQKVGAGKRGVRGAVGVDR